MTATPASMQAVTFSRYGGPETMRLATVPVPDPGAGQVRIRVAAASINPYDWHLYRGDPYFARLSFGLMSPGEHVVGSDVAGVVDAVGPGVERFAVGDRVFGSIGFGACGQYAVGDVSSLTLCPAGVDLASAAALPMAGITALQGLRALGVEEGSRVLVIGASGGVGHLAVQIANALGAGRVVGVASAGNAALLRDCGADATIDYRTQRVEDAGEVFDAVFDTVATTPLSRLKRVIAPGGTYVPIGALGGGRLLGPMSGIFRSRIHATLHRVNWRMVMASITSTDLETLALWAEHGMLRAAIDAEYPLSRTSEALARLEGGHVAGKLLIRVE